MLPHEGQAFQPDGNPSGSASTGSGQQNWRTTTSGSDGRGVGWQTDRAGDAHIAVRLESLTYKNGRPRLGPSEGCSVRKSRCQALVIAEHFAIGSPLQGVRNIGANPRV